jgi:hypothetical protein
MMMGRVAFFISILLFAVSSSAQVRLNEFLGDPGIDWNGDGTVSSKTDEWVEIINSGLSPVDLANYCLGDESGGYTWRFMFSGILAPGEIRIVYGSDAVEWQTGTGYPAYGLSLNNSGDTVFLYRVSGGDTVIADQYTFASAEVLDDRSIGRETDGAGVWAIFDGMNPYASETPPYGTGCNPSPGFHNGCVTPSNATSWGVIKRQFSN